MMIFTPRQYQRDAANFLWKHPCSALLADPGTGKTAIMLAIIKHLRATRGSRVLVIAPMKVAQIVWPAEVWKWDQFSGLPFSILHGPKKTRIADEQTDIHLLNIDGIPWAAKTKLFARYDTLILDESSKLKAWTSKRYRALKPWLLGFKRRHILTGSPMPLNLLDYFAQQYIVDLGESLGTAITHFRNDWFNDVAYKQEYSIWVPRKGALEHVLSSIRPFAYRLDGEKLLDLPALVFNDIRDDLANVVEYKKMLAESLAPAGARQMLARQLTSGYLADGGVFHEQKMTMLSDLVDELQGKPLLVAFCFRAEGEAIAKRFNCPLIYGGVKTSDSARILEEWNEGKHRVVAVNPSTTGHGLNLQSGGHHICFFSLTTNQDDYYQEIRRLRRPGQKAKTVFVNRLIQLLDDKTEAQERFLKGV